ncbi:MAG: DUF2147 domain-containing protein [Cyclobacteriaceae bacterium]
MSIAFLGLYLINLINPAQEISSDDILGVWLTDDKESQIEIYKKNNLYFGKVIWMLEPNNEDGTPKTDINNPKKPLQSREIIGLNIIENFSFNGDEWTDGEIYDPNNGKTYSCVMKLEGDQLEVRGYVGISLFGRTVVWTRVNSN